MLGIKFLHKRICNPDTGEVYLERWELDFWQLFSVKLHHIWREDFGRATHTHPWVFCSWILAGGYKERLHRYGRETTKWVYPLQFLSRGLEIRHRIDEVRSPCWTLVLCGPRKRVWGFWPDDKTWVPHHEYLKAGLQDGDMGGPKWESRM